MNIEKPHTIKYREPIFGEEVSLPVVPGREPNKEAWEAITRLRAYSRLFSALERARKVIEDACKKNPNGLPF